MSKAFVWATVTGIGPLRVQVDGDTAPLPITPKALVDDLKLTVSDRVFCVMSNRRITVLGRTGADGVRQVNWSTGTALAAGAEVELTVTIPQVCAIARVTTSAAARVRLYDRAAKSTADASRASGVVPTGDHGLLLEIDGGVAAETLAPSPAFVIANGEASTAYKLRVKNLGGSSATITGSLVTLL